MAPSIQELGLDRLSIDDRLEVAQAIQDHVVEEIESAPLAQWQMDEIQRRLEKRKDRPLTGMPWEDLLARALARAMK